MILSPHRQFSLIAFVLGFVVACSPISNKNSGGSPGSDTDAVRANAAAATAKNNSACTAIAPFYWEIGAARAILASGSTGDGSITRDTSLAIASASKWLFGAYVLEKLNGTLDNDTIQHLTMKSGYTNFGNLSCIGTTTVTACANTGTNASLTSANVGSFYYNGGHYQHWAMTHGMSAMNLSQLATEYRSVLGTDLDLQFSSPQLAGGIRMTAGNYATFLQKILDLRFKISLRLGENKVCTLSSSSCTTSVSSPIPVDFHYSYGHWVEDDSNSDGSFSSPGLFGFYPWISSDLSRYGIISRYKIPTGGDEIGEGWASLLCGQKIRKAYEDGVEVTN